MKTLRFLIAAALVPCLCLGAQAQTYQPAPGGGGGGGTLPPNIVLTDGSDNIVITGNFLTPGALVATQIFSNGGDPSIDLSDPSTGYLRDDGTPVMAWTYTGINILGQLSVTGPTYMDNGLTGTDGNGNLYIGNSIYLGDSTSGAGIYGPSGAHLTDDGYSGWVSTGDFTTTRFIGDGSNLTNLTPPAGLHIFYNEDAGGFGGYLPELAALYTTYQSVGDFYVGDGEISPGTQVLSGPNTLGPLDAGNLANVPLPAGLNLDNFTGGGVLCTGFYTSSGNGDSLQVGGTLIIDHPGTLAALDGSALTGYAINLIVGGAVDAAGAINPFDDFFHAYGLNLDTSLPGNGTASFANGNFYIDQGGNMVIAGNLQAAAALQTFGGIGVFGHGAPVTQPATPTTQAQMVAVLQAYGLCQ